MSDMAWIQGAIDKLRKDSFDAGVASAAAAAEAESKGVQRDDEWLQQATPEQIYGAFEAGELNTLMGRPK